MPVLTFHGRVSSVGFDKEKDGEGNVVEGGTTAMNYLTVKFNPPDDEFSELGAADDPLNLKGPHATLFIYNMTIPNIEKALLYGKAKLTVEFETEKP